MTAPTATRTTSTDDRHSDADLMDAFSGLSAALADAETQSGLDTTDGRPPAAESEETTPADDATSAPSSESETDGGPDAPDDAEAERTQPQPEDADGVQDTADNDALLEGATPLAYTVDGESKSLDWITEVPGQGAFVPADKLTQFRDLIQRGEHADGERRRLYQVASEYQQLGGRQAYEKLAAEKAMLDAAGGKLLDIFQRPDADQVLLELATNPQARAMLLKEAQLEARDAGWKARTDLTTAQGTAERQTQEAAQAAQALTITIDNVAKQVPGLTADDVQTARAYFNSPQMRTAIYRRATVQDQQQYGLTPGELVLVPQAIYQWMQDRATLRSSTASAQAKAQAATRENATRLAAAAPVKGSTPRSGARPGAGKKTEASQRKIDTMSFEDIKRGALSGRLLMDLADD